MWRNRFCGNLALLTALLAALHSCSIIDEDMSDCGVDNDIDYSLKLVTNITTELSTELRTEQDSPNMHTTSTSPSTTPPVPTCQGTSTRRTS